MKSLILIAVIMFPFLAGAVDKPVRKVSSSLYYFCTIERDAADKKNFKREYHFPFPSESGETYEVKGSLRWNKFKLLFSHDKSVKISVQERMKEGIVEAEKELAFKEGEPIRAVIELKNGDEAVPYKFFCGPE